MKYRLKKGVVLFPMCGEFFIVPSREAGFRAPVILSASEELAGVLNSEENTGEKELSENTLKKLRSFTAAGILEEY